ncbi:hypothetical protein PIB30_073220, partial [Stylosanthes scabra]|nr:hypothetical protein [Stylosanthes scabra]
KKSKRKLGNQEKRKTELQGKNRANDSNRGLIQHPTLRHVVRCLGMDEAARKMTLHQGLNA